MRKMMRLKKRSISGNNGVEGNDNEENNDDEVEDEEEATEDPLFSEWMERLKALKVKLSANPGPVHTQVAKFGKPSDTYQVKDWAFNGEDVHLIAIRKPPVVPRIFDANRNDALFILLIEGKVYKFWGFTGYFNAKGNNSNNNDLSLAIMAEGQHKYAIDKTRSVKALIPFQDGVLFFRDRDKNKAFSARDIRAGLYSEPIETADIQWAPLGIDNDKTGVQFISNKRYINHDDDIISKSQLTDTDNALLGEGGSSTDAYEAFTDLIWGLTERDWIYYTLVDWNDFDTESKADITNTLNRLKNGVQ